MISGPNRWRIFYFRSPPAVSFALGRIGAAFVVGGKIYVRFAAAATGGRSLGGGAGGDSEQKVRKLGLSNRESVPGFKPRKCTGKRGCVFFPGFETRKNRENRD